MKERNSFFYLFLAIGLILLFIASLSYLLYINYTAGDSAFWQMVINGFLLSIPLILFYFSIGLLLSAFWQTRGGARVHDSLKKSIYWTPRVAGLLIIAFISLFSLDVFSEEYTLSEMLIGFFIHMLPSIALFILLLIAWRWEWFGFLAFLAAAGAFAVLAMRNQSHQAAMLLLFTGPLLAIALLLGIGWRWLKAPESANTDALL